VPKLNQIIAVVSGKKNRCQKDLTEIYKKLQKSTLFDGISRTYHPSDEEGETFPAERKNIQYQARQAIIDAREALKDMIDVVATQDAANCNAKADVVVEGNTVLSDVPVTHLIFLEKQLTDLSTFISTIPTLDPSEKWEWDEVNDCHGSEPFFSNKTKKIPRSHVLYEATEKHPAQTEMYHEDVKVGQWRTVKFSGAMPAQEKNEMLQRVRKLGEAVKFAREKANGAEVKNVYYADKVFDFVFGAQA